MAEPMIDRFLAALAETQYYTPERMVSYQQRPLDKLLRHARNQTDFYADRLAPVFRADDTFDRERFAEIPILTRAEAQRNTGPLTARHLPPIAGGTHRSTTSGSTGRPFEHLSNDLQHVGSACANERFFRWHKLDPAPLAAFIRAYSDSSTAYPHGRFNKGWRLGCPDSPRAELTIDTTIEQQIEWLRRIQPGILLSYPSNLREIGRQTAAAGEPFRLHALLTTGEAILPEMHADIRADFGLDPLDQYGSSEVGHVAGTCPHSGLHHIASELVHVEIVDEGGAILPPGQEGRIVATPFYNLAMPLIRYDTGDYGVLSPEPCGCGRTLPVLQRILGRTRNIFRFVDGTHRWPLLWLKDVKIFVPHRQCQVVQVALDRIELRYIPVAPGQVNDEAGLADLVHQRLHPSVQTKLVAVEHIDRSKSGKFDEYVSLVGDAGDNGAAGHKSPPTHTPSRLNKPPGHASLS